MKKIIFLVFLIVNLLYGSSMGGIGGIGDMGGGGGGGGAMACTIKAIDAQETDDSITNKLRTKIVNKDFKFIADSKEAGIGCYKNKYEARYYLVDDNNNSIMDEQSVTLNPAADIVDEDLNDLHFFDPNDVNKSYKSLWVIVKACTEPDGDKYDLYDYGDCDRECNSNDENAKCIRKFISSDNFAVRPNNFVIEVNKTQRADVNFSSIIIKALDNDGNPTKNYNVSSDDINITFTDNNSTITNKEVKYSFQFRDGVAYINYLKYPEVGEGNLTISEIKDTEYAYDTDKDDDSKEELRIESNHTKSFHIVPDYFDINVTNVSNFKKGNFTYLSKDLNMSSELNFTIVAKNHSGEVTKNYAYKYGYTDDLNITISHSNVNTNNLNYILTQYSKNNKDKNISLIYPAKDANFSNGEANLSLMINFDRNHSKVVNMFDFNLSKINILDEYNKTNSEENTTGKSDINKTLNFRYGSIYADNVLTYSDSARIIVNFIYYDNGWKLNLDHNKTYGDVNYTYPEDSDLHEDEVINGVQKIDTNITSDVRPYKEILHLSIPTWLWYSKYSDYKAPSKKNQDCATHPCVSIIAKDSSSYWSGEGMDNGYNNPEKNTVEVNISKQDENRSIYNKLSW